MLLDKGIFLWVVGDKVQLFPGSRKDLRLPGLEAKKTELLSHDAGFLICWHLLNYTSDACVLDFPLYTSWRCFLLKKWAIPPLPGYAVQVKGPIWYSKKRIFHCSGHFPFNVGNILWWHWKCNIIVQEGRWNRYLYEQSQCPTQPGILSPCAGNDCARHFPIDSRDGKACRTCGFADRHDQAN